MKLKSAVGSFPMQQALAHSYVRTIVDIVLRNRETLWIVAEVLQTYVRSRELGLEKKLAGIRTSYSKFDNDGNSFVPAHIISLTENLYNLYQQDLEKIKYQRGAVLELFVRRLVCPRYLNEQECSNSRIFVDDSNQAITIQEVDVAALSVTRLQAEGYECKLKAKSLASEDCIDFAYLVMGARENGYHINVGIVSFDSDRLVLRELNAIRALILHLPEDVLRSIRVYGIDSIEKLQSSPF